jgi:hypothetical protein
VYPGPCCPVLGNCGDTAPLVWPRTLSEVPLCVRLPLSCFWAWDYVPVPPNSPSWAPGPCLGWSWSVARLVDVVCDWIPQGCACVYRQRGLQDRLSGGGPGLVSMGLKAPVCEDEWAWPLLQEDTALRDWAAFTLHCPGLQRTGLPEPASSASLCRLSAARRDALIFHIQTVACMVCISMFKMVFTYSWLFK